jgi:hypothetical protein
VTFHLSRKASVQIYPVNKKNTLKMILK